MSETDDFWRNVSRPIAERSGGQGSGVSRKGESTDGTVDSGVRNDRRSNRDCAEYKDDKNNLEAYHDYVIGELLKLSQSIEPQGLKIAFDEMAQTQLECGNMRARQ